MDKKVKYRGSGPWFLSKSESIRFKNAIKTTGKTQVAIAKELNVSRSYLCRVLNQLEPKNPRVIKFLENLNDQLTKKNNS